MYRNRARRLRYQLRAAFVALPGAPFPMRRRRAVSFRNRSTRLGVETARRGAVYVAALRLGAEPVTASRHGARIRFGAARRRVVAVARFARIYT